MRPSTFDLQRILFTDSMTDGVLAKDAKGGGYTAGFAGGSGAATMVGSSGN